MNNETTPRFEAVVHIDHPHLHGVKADLPLAEGSVLRHHDGGPLDGCRCAYISIVPEEEIYKGGIQPNKLFITAVAILDWKSKLIYTNEGCSGHADLCEKYPEKLYSRSRQDNQIWLHNGLIYGYVTSGGYFVNRQLAASVAKLHHPELLKDYEPNSSSALYSYDVDWVAVNKKIKALQRATTNQTK